MAKKIVRAHQKLADGSYDTLHYETEKAAIVDFEHTHDDRYYTEAEMNTKLNAKEPAFTKNNAFNKNFGTAAGTVCQGDSRLSNARRASNITMSLSGTTLTINYS